MVRMGLFWGLTGFPEIEIRGVIQGRNKLEEGLGYMYTIIRIRIIRSPPKRFKTPF